MAVPTAPGPEKLEELLAKQAILELLHAYSRAVDRQDFALLASLYTPDGSDDHPGLYCGSAAGYVEWLRRAMKAVDLTTHQVHQATISVHGRRAEGEVYVTAYNRLHRPGGGFEELVQGLRYLDRYREDEGSWRFEHRSVVVDWAQHRPAFWGAPHPLLDGKRWGLAGAEDPSYRILADRTFARRG
jgi:ketosteroid isomerase-like protein